MPFPAPNHKAKVFIWVPLATLARNLNAAPKECGKLGVDNRTCWVQIVGMTENPASQAGERTQNEILKWLESHAADIRKRPSGRWQVLNYDGVLGEGDTIQGAALAGIEEQITEGRPHGIDPALGPCECEQCEEFDRLLRFLEPAEKGDVKQPISIGPVICKLCGFCKPCRCDRDMKPADQ